MSLFKIGEDGAAIKSKPGKIKVDPNTRKCIVGHKECKDFWVVEISGSRARWDSGKEKALVKTEAEWEKMFARPKSNLIILVDAPEPEK